MSECIVHPDSHHHSELSKLKTCLNFLWSATLAILKDFVTTSIKSHKITKHPTKIYQNHEKNWPTLARDAMITGIIVVMTWNLSNKFKAAIQFLQSGWATQDLSGRFRASSALAWFLLSAKATSQRTRPRRFHVTCFQHGPRCTLHCHLQCHAFWGIIAKMLAHTVQMAKHTKQNSCTVNVIFFKWYQPTMVNNLYCVRCTFISRRASSAYETRDATHQRPVSQHAVKRVDGYPVHCVSLVKSESSSSS